MLMIGTQCLTVSRSFSANSLGYVLLMTDVDEVIQSMAVRILSSFLQTCR
jgi:hypothetical protein